MTPGSPPCLALVGLGKMGNAVHTLARERGVPVTVTLSRQDLEGDPGAARARLAEADVAVEFTRPDSATRNIRFCVEAGCPVVVGTTGWYGELEPTLAHVRAHDGTLLWDANFSVGVQVLAAALERAGELLGPLREFDAHLVETHHTAKRDAPSGTAVRLEQRLSAALGRSVPITSIRTGHVPGAHEIVFDGPFEQLRLGHRARDRRVFADGALRAALWLHGRSGIFTMADVLGLTAHDVSNPTQEEGS